MKHLLLASLLLASAAHSCPNPLPSNALCAQWEAPTRHEDRMPIVLPITYNLYMTTGEWSQSSSWTRVGTTSERFLVVPNLSPGTYHFRVRAVVNGVEGGSSITASRMITQAVPAPEPTPPPVSRVVATVADSNESPVFTVLSSGDRSTTFGGLASVGTECTGPVLFTYLGREWRTPVTWKRRTGIAATARVAAPCS